MISVQNLLLPLAEQIETGWLTGVLLGFVRGGAEWGLWLLVVLSLVSVAIMVERVLFYRRHKADAHALREMVIHAVDSGDGSASAAALGDGGNSMESNVLRYGFQHLERGARAVEELMAGALSRERLRYERYLAYLGTLGNNAPFIGLFGTVLGIINAFDGLRAIDGDGAAAAGSAVMGPIAEALIATGVGLLVAIPAVVAFNVFKRQVKRATSNTELLVRTMIAYMNSASTDDTTTEGN